MESDSSNANCSNGSRNWNSKWLHIHCKYNTVFQRQVIENFLIMFTLTMQIGGYDKKSIDLFDTVERYNPATNMWETVSSMLSERSSMGVGTLNGTLYIAGGCDGNGILNTIDKYNTTTNVWERVIEMEMYRSNPGKRTRIWRTFYLPT